MQGIQRQAMQEQSCLIAKENRESELARLRREADKTRHDEVFGGLTRAEHIEYNRKLQRINELEIEMSAPKEKRSA
jgi:hypothetical protein